MEGYSNHPVCVCVYLCVLPLELRGSSGLELSKTLVGTISDREILAFFCPVEFLINNFFVIYSSHFSNSLVCLCYLCYRISILFWCEEYFEL